MSIPMMSPKKKIASVIVASLGKPEGEQLSEGDEVQQDNSVFKESAANKILRAIETKDAKMLYMALEDFAAICDSDYEDSDSETME